MGEGTPHDSDDEPHADGEQAERRDAASRAGDLERMARDAADATWGETDASRARVPGVLSGDLGPKGTVSSQLRDLSRSERGRHGEVPPGAVAPGSGRMLLLTMLGLGLALLALAVLVGWLLA